MNLVKSRVALCKFAELCHTALVVSESAARGLGKQITR